MINLLKNIFKSNKTPEPLISDQELTKLILISRSNIRYLKSLINHKRAILNAEPKRSRKRKTLSEQIKWYEAKLEEEKIVLKEYENEAKVREINLD